MDEGRRNILREVTGIPLPGGGMDTIGELYLLRDTSWQAP